MYLQDVLNALSGGALIGFSAALVLIVNGRILGVSGIIGQIFIFKNWRDVTWRVVFLVVLFLTGVFLSHVRPEWFDGQPPLSRFGLALAGLLVGFGTQLGNGCTSGHGVCGISRLSKRSVIATLVFMGTAILTVAIRRFLTGSAGL